MYRLPIRPLVVALAAIALLPATSHSDVSLKNGNYYIEFADLSYTGGFTTRIARFYNSKAPFKGIFGWGWGCEYELYLDVMGDGSVLVHENGNGAENLFSPTAPSPGDLEIAIERITTAATQAKAIASSEQANRYQAKLRDDVTFRNDEWTKYVKAKQLAPRTVEVGERFTSFRFNYQYIVRTVSGYQRHYQNGRVESFDAVGRLTRIADQNNNWLEFAYGPNGRWSRLEDNLHRSLAFVWRPDSLLASVTGSDGKAASFRYNSSGELVYSRDQDGVVNTFGYTPDGRHNLARVGFADGRAIAVTYYGLDLEENVKSVKDKDGWLTQYTYAHPAPDRLVVGVKVRDEASQLLSTSSYEYVTRRRLNGEEWVERLITVINGERLEQVNNECCERPVLKIRGPDSARFSYDLRGRLISKETALGVDSLEYHPVRGKVVKAVHWSRPEQQRSWYGYSYDERGNLLEVIGADSLRIILEYDANGQTSRMGDGRSNLTIVLGPDQEISEIRDSLGFYRFRSKAGKPAAGDPAIRERFLKLATQLQSAVKLANVTTDF